MLLSRRRLFLYGLVLVGLICVVWYVAYSIVVHEENQTTASAGNQARQLSGFFEEHTKRIFRYSDNYTKSVRSAYAKGSIKAVRELIQTVPPDYNIVSHATVIDENGTPLLVSGHKIRPGTSAKDRDYFKFHKNNDKDEVFISLPLRGRNSQILTLRIARRITLPDGRFGGVVFSAVKIGPITEFFKALNLGEQSSATLVGTDKKIRARSSYGRLGPGQDISGSRIWRELAQTRTGLYKQTSVVDGITRFYAYRKLAEYPLVVAIGVSLFDISEPVGRFRFISYLMASLATLLIIVSYFFVINQLSNRMRLEADIEKRKNTEIALRESEMHFRDLIEGSDFGIRIERPGGKRLFANNKCVKMFGYESAEEYMAALSVPGTMVAQHDRKRMLKNRKARKQLDDALNVYQYDALRKDGEVIPVEVFTQEIVWNNEPALQRTFVDLTERKRAEKAHLESEERLRAFIDHSPSLIYLKDTESRILMINKAYQQHYGVSQDDAFGSEGYEWQERTNVDKLKEQDQKVILNGEPIETEINRKDATGNTTILQSIKFSVRDSDGNIVGIGGIGSDVTEQRNAAEVVRESEARFRDLIESSVLGTSIADQNGRRIFANQAMAKLMGYDMADEIIALDRGEIIAPHDMARTRAHWTAMQRGEDVPPHYEIEIIHRDGRFIPVQCFCRQIVWEGVDAIQRIYIDLTERKRAEKALFESEEKLRKAFENTGIGMSIRNTKDRTILCNDALCQILGYSQEELEALHLNDITYPDDREETQKTRGKLISGEIDSYQVTKRLLRKDGEPIWLNNDLSTIRDDDGRIIFTINLFHDLTESRKGEEILHRARLAAEAANRSKSEFLANMSHELRTPLNAIIGFSETMKRQIFGPLDNPKYVEYVADIHQAGNHLLDLINDILDLSKIEAGEVELDENVINVSEIVASSMLLVNERAENGGVKLTVNTPDALEPFYADERALKQILINLLSNAIKFTPSGGEVTVNVWSGPDTGYNFQIVDTGVGMALEDIPIALAPFKQLDGAINRKFEGTGLGLSLTKTLVEMHGGSLDIQSELGIGTTITVRFPPERIVSVAATGT
ncbi:MAG: PAS domain S-box-containing protein [Alphaproteobacteria bacterium]|jgi:PAS domain S-box-containing protein